MKNVHEEAQLWGKKLLLWYLKSNGSWQEAEQLGLIESDYIRHLAHCWEIENCRIIRSLVNAIPLYSPEEFKKFYSALIKKIDLEKEDNEPY